MYKKGILEIEEKIKEINNLNIVIKKQNDNNIKIKDLISILNKKIDEEKNKNK